MPEPRGIAIASLAAAGVTALWIGMSAATPLIFHFHPVLVGGAMGYVYRRASGRPIGVAALGVILLLTAAFLLVGFVAITTLNGGLDAAWVVAAFGLTGLAAGVALVRPRHAG